MAAASAFAVICGDLECPNILCSTMWINCTVMPPAFGEGNQLCHVNVAYGGDIGPASRAWIGILPECSYYRNDAATAFIVIWCAKSARSASEKHA